MTESHWTRQRLHLILKVLIPTVIGVFLFWQWGKEILSVLAPFLVAFLVAYVFNPVVLFLEGRKGNERRMRRIFAVGLLYLGFILLLAVAGLILVQVVQELVIFAERLPDYGAKLYDLCEKYLVDQLQQVPPELKTWILDQLDPEHLKQLFIQYVQPQIEDADLAGGVGTAVKGFAGFFKLVVGLLMATLGRIIGGAGSVVRFITMLSMVLVIAFYLLVDYERLFAALKRLIPDGYQEDVLRIARRIDLQLSGFLRGQILICVCIGTLVAIGLSLLGVDYALIIGLAAGAFNIVPYLGPVMGAIPAVIVTVLDEYQPAVQAATDAAGQAVIEGTDWGHMIYRLGLVIGVFVIVQTLDGFLISPKIMGNKLDLHPMIILLALMLGGTMFGLVGMLIAVPIACMIRVLVEEVYFPDLRRSTV